MKVRLYGTLKVYCHIDEIVTIPDEEAPNDGIELFDLLMNQLDIEEIVEHSCIERIDDDRVVLEILVPKKATEPQA